MPSTGGPPTGETTAELLAGYAAALGGDPWLERWPAVLDVTPTREAASPVPAVSDVVGVPCRCTRPSGWTACRRSRFSSGRPVSVAASGPRAACGR